MVVIAEGPQACGAPSTSVVWSQSDPLLLSWYGDRGTGQSYSYFPTSVTLLYSLVLTIPVVPNFCFRGVGVLCGGGERLTGFCL